MGGVGGHSNDHSDGELQLWKMFQDERDVIEFVLVWMLPHSFEVFWRMHELANLTGSSASRQIQFPQFG